jgi:RHS repeat-associated protein
MTKTDQHAGVTSNYTYDPLYELTQVTQGANTTESYTYDPVGSRLSSLGLSPYVNNTSNELTSTPNASYAYDYNGNTTSKTVSSGTTNYTWDYENRLASVTLAGTGGSITFKYDPLGRRIQKVFTQNSTSTTINYLYDGSNAVVDIDQNGNVLARYAETQDIDEPLAELRSGTTSYYEADGLGSVTSLSNGAGAIANTYAYDSFGNVTASTGSITNRFQYTAREFDSESGLYYYRARYYDSLIGRFTSEDPLRFHGGLNYYRYVFNHAVNYRDPDGLQCDFFQPFDGHYGQPVAPPAIGGFPFLPGGFFYYGNWGGPGWTGGQLTSYENLTQAQRSKLAPPTDEQDVCYMNHDVCYAKARCNYAGCNRAITKAQGSCDMDLYYCLTDLSKQNGFSRVARPFFSLLELIK